MSPKPGARHARCSRGGVEESAERSHDFPDDQRALLCFQRPVSAVRLSSLLFLAASRRQLIATLPFLRLISTYEKVHRRARVSSGLKVTIHLEGLLKSQPTMPKIDNFAGAVLITPRILLFSTWRNGRHPFSRLRNAGWGFLPLELRSDFTCWNCLKALEN